jgi:hypothetical protein
MKWKRRPSIKRESILFHCWWLSLYLNSKIVAGPMPADSFESIGRPGVKVKPSGCLKVWSKEKHLSPCHHFHYHQILFTEDIGKALLFLG